MKITCDILSPDFTKDACSLGFFFGQIEFQWVRLILVMLTYTNCWDLMTHFVCLIDLIAIRISQERLPSNRDSFTMSQKNSFAIYTLTHDGSYKKITNCPENIYAEVKKTFLLK